MINCTLFGQSVSVMSFNIRYDNYNDGQNKWQNRKQEVTELIKDYHPDFLGIQEGLFNQIQFMIDSLHGYNYIGVGRDDGKQAGEFSAVLYDTTKFHPEDIHTFWLSKTPAEVSVGWDASMERICTFGRFVHNASARNFYVFNTHFDHMGRKARKNSAKLIMLTIKEMGIKDSCIVVMGDLNSLPSEKPVKVLSGFLQYPRNTNTVAIEGPAGTYNGFDTTNLPAKQIDYIFSKNLIPKQYIHINDKRQNGLWISDHLPVYGVFEYR